MGTLFGVAALYVFLAADFVAGAQFLIYIGGVLVLILFAVMLTHRIADVAVSESFGRTAAGVPDGDGGGDDHGTRALMKARWLGHGDAASTRRPRTRSATASSGRTSCPFELASLVLLAVLVGAIVVSRKELRELEGAMPGVPLQHGAGGSVSRSRA